MITFYVTIIEITISRKSGWGRINDLEIGNIYISLRLRLLSRQRSSREKRWSCRLFIGSRFDEMVRTVRRTRRIA